jgi:hypothetical protein
MADHRSEQREILENTIAKSLEELRQLHYIPTLDDFQDYRRRRLEFSLIDMRLELRILQAKSSIGDAGPQALPIGS